MFSPQARDQTRDRSSLKAVIPEYCNLEAHHDPRDEMKPQSPAIGVGHPVFLTLLSSLVDGQRAALVVGLSTTWCRLECK